MALQTFTWKNGTDEHPVELNPAQMSLLLKLALDTSVQSDVRGHIKTSSGRIAKYTKWQLNQKYGENLVIHAEEDADVFSLIPVRNAINEGESTVITVTGMSASSVKFRLLHSFRNVYGISQDAAQARIHMEGNTLVVNQPEENASWTDEVTVQAIPLYEDWSTVDPSSIASCTVTVTAKEITGIALIAPSMAVYGETFQSEVTLVPSSNTKKNFVTLDASCISDGTIQVRKPTAQGVFIYTQAPAEQCNLTLTVNAYLFNDLETIVFSSTQSGIQSAIPSIIFTVTTDGTFSDISTANPKITLQKVDSQDNPIGEPVVLTGTVSGSSLVYTYGNGNIAGDGTETYQVTFGEAPEGYRNIQQMTIIPNQVITEIAVQYIVMRPGLYVVYRDGSYETFTQVEENGRLSQPLTNLVGVGIVTEDTAFLIAVRDNEVMHGPTYTRKLISSTSPCPMIVGNVSRTYSSSNRIAFTDFDGEKNTIVIANYFTEHSELIDDDGCIPFVREKSVTYGNRTYYGFIPALGQLGLINSNVSILNNFINAYCGFSTYFPWRYEGIWSSTGGDQAKLYWNANSSDPNGASIDQGSKRYFIPCYEFNVDGL